MRIALVGPARVSDLAPRLDGDAPALAALSGSSVVGHLATTLHDRGHDVLVVTLSPDVGSDPVRLAGAGLEVRVGHYRPSHRARDAFAGERREVRSLLQEGTSPDVVHAHWTYEFALAALAGSPPAVVTVHDWAPRVLRFQPHPYRVVRLGLAARVLRVSRHTTAVSPYLADRVQRWTRRRPVLVPNGIPEGEFASTGPTGAPRGAFVAINDGFSRWKNVATLLRAFALLRRGRPEARLRLIGRDHGPGETAQRWADGAGLTAGVEFLGHLPRGRAMDELAGAVALVHPSLEESFGLVLVEAMARRVPVIAGRHSGAVPWVCGDGAAASLVDVTSPPGLAGAMSAALEGGDRIREQVEAGYDHARRRFTLDRVAAGYEAVYERARGESR